MANNNYIKSSNIYWIPPFR